MENHLNDKFDLLCVFIDHFFTMPIAVLSKQMEIRNDRVFRFVDIQTGMSSTVPGGINKRRKLDK